MTFAKRLAVGLIGAAALIASMGAEGGCGANSGGTRKADTPASSVASPAAVTEEPPVTEAPKPTPRASWYQVKVKTLSKQCFGSAGCNVDVRLTLVIVNEAAEGVATEITVSVSGDESGPSIETITVDEDGKYDAPELSLSTRSNGTTVKAKVTAVEAA